MGLNLRLDAKMTQSLVMTPRLQQAIKLLQYNHLEMVAHVQQEMLENPTLEAVPDSDGDGLDDRELELRDRAADVAREESESSGGQDESIDWERYLEQMSDHRPSASTGGTIHDELPPIETNLTYGESLAEHLFFQIRMTHLAPDEERAVEAILHNLDGRGYLLATVEELAEATGVEVETVEDALELVQDLDPPGVGARDLVECLIIQARRLYPEDEDFLRILREHLHNLEKRNYPAIARDLCLEIEDVIEYHRMIQELEPRPGRAFTGEDARYITPDIYVGKVNGEWQILLNEDGMPDLRVSRYYQKILRAASKTDKEYLLEKLRGAEFLIKSINKRRKTIRRVMESIIKFQREFFDHGVERLRPLVLQDVADDVNVHMSTVSRVTTNKFVHTPHGIFELKYFFSAGVRQQSGDDMAAEAIKSRIKSIITEEDRKKPWSDQAIAKLLEKDGIRIARRTVAKYREAMGLLPSSQRKQMF